MARPLASVAFVRVSDTVTTKQRTTVGETALCSMWLTGELCNRGTGAQGHRKGVR